MYASIWSKYFPVVKILMKKSVNSEQILQFSGIDFEHLGKGRKADYKFNIIFIDGKLNNNFSKNELAASLIAELMSDATTNALLLVNNYEFSFTPKFQLSIKNTEKHRDHSEEDIGKETSMI